MYINKLYFILWYRDFVSISLDSIIVEGSCRWKLSSGNLYTFQFKVPDRNRTCGPVIPVQRSNQLYRGQLSTFTEASYRGQLSTFDHMKFMYIYIRYTAMFRLYMGKYQDFVGISFDSITVEGSCLWHRPMFPMSRSNPQTGNLHQWVMFCIWVCLIFHIRVMMSLGWIFYIWSGIEFVWRFHSWLLANQKPWTFQVNNTCLLALARTRGNRNLWPKKHVWFFLILYEPCNFLHKSNVFHEGPLLEPSRSTFLSFISWLACARSLIMTLSNDVISNVLHCLRLRAQYNLGHNPWDRPSRHCKFNAPLT